MKKIIVFILCFVLLFPFSVVSGAVAETESELTTREPVRPTKDAIGPEYSDINNVSLNFYVVNGKAVVSYFVASSAAGIKLTIQVYKGTIFTTKVGDSVTVSTGEKFISGECVVPVASDGKYLVKMKVQTGDDNYTFSSNFDYEYSVLAGDSNGDGVIRADDARRILRYSAKLENYDSKDIEICDVDKDSRITAADARIVLRISASLI